MNKKANWERIVEIIVLLTLIGSAIYSAVHIYLAATVPNPQDVNSNVKSDYVLMLLQCIFGIIVMFLPSLLEKRIRISIPDRMYLLFVIFLYCAIYLGEVRSFYYIVPHWDTILHTFSGVMLGALGFSLVNILNNNDKITMDMSPLFIAFFAFCFAVTLGVIWEIYEFTFDGILGLNMQKFKLANGIPLVGRRALEDTMKDLIVDVIGAFTISAIGFISIKEKKDWLKKYKIRIFKKK